MTGERRKLLQAISGARIRGVLFGFQRERESRKNQIESCPNEAQFRLFVPGCRELQACNGSVLVRRVLRQWVRSNRDSNTDRMAPVSRPKIGRLKNPRF